MRILNLLRRKRGFTLVELLVSIAIFGILMVAFLSLFLSAVAYTLRAGKRDETVADLSGELERKMATGAYDGSVITTSTDNTFTITFAEGTANEDTQSYPVDVTTGTKTNSDGTTVTINSYETAVGP